jgi:cellulose biosynthesis protein BcsQ
MTAKVITISNRLGGSGKTTLVFNFAYMLANKGFKVLVVDLDPRAFLTHYFNIDEKSLAYSVKDLLVKSTVFWKTTLFIKNNLYLIPSCDSLLGMDYHLLGKPFSYLQLARKLEPAKSEHDFIIIDTPSYFNLFTVNAWNFSDLIVSPFVSEPAGIEGVAGLLKSLEGLPVELAIVLNRLKKSDKYKDYFKETFKRMAPDNFFITGEIDDSDLVLESLFKKQPLIELFDNSDIVKQFDNILNKLVVKA